MAHSPGVRGIREQLVLEAWLWSWSDFNLPNLQWPMSNLLGLRLKIIWHIAVTGQALLYHLFDPTFHSGPLRATAYTASYQRALLPSWKHKLREWGPSGIYNSNNIGQVI